MRILWKGLNSPFSITLISGAVIGFLSVFIQDNLQSNRERLVQKQERDRFKQEVITEFADDISKSLTYSYQMRQMIIFLATNKDNREKKFRDMYSYDEILVKYEDLWSRYIELRNPDVSCTRALMIVTNTVTRSKIEQIDSLFDSYNQEVKDEAKLMKNKVKIETLYQEVIVDMASELNPTVH